MDDVTHHADSHPFCPSAPIYTDDKQETALRNTNSTYITAYDTLHRPSTPRRGIRKVLSKIHTRIRRIIARYMITGSMRREILQRSRLIFHTP